MPPYPTDFKIRYDDDALYVAIRCWDYEPEKIQRQVARRDGFAGDIVGIALDTYHDLLTAYEFNLTAAGAKIDLLHKGNKEWDTTWDAVWEGKTAVEDSAWTAEYRIPLSQLRFRKAEEQVWGIFLWRQLDRLQEESHFQLIPQEAPAMVNLFGELHGIRGLRPARRIELLPYTLLRASRFDAQEGNPFATGHRESAGVGLDAKVGLSSSFTVDLTVNPDFGQVEADPSVMNLTAFETFYQEKRPFFLEGSNILSYPLGSDRLFHSRRIGSTPKYAPSLGADEYARVPETISILSAAKLTGKPQRGLSVGILQSVTQKEMATLQTADGRHQLAVEPLTSFTVGRVQQEYRGGNTILGAMVTSVDRGIDDPQLEFLAGGARTGGVDFKHQWQKKTYYVEAKAVARAVRGAAQAITRLPRNGVHRNQRPEADSQGVDTTRTRLSGYGGSLEAGRMGNGRWRYTGSFAWQSPGLELNDAGYLRVADALRQGTSLGYVVNDPSRWFRSWSLAFQQANAWSFGGERTQTTGGLERATQLSNLWRVNVSAAHTWSALDTRLLRGGPALRVPGGSEASLTIRSDTRRALRASLTGKSYRSDEGLSREQSITPDVTWRVSPALNLSGSLRYTATDNDLQYVAAPSLAGVPRFVLGRVDQQTAQLTFRVSYSPRPDISVQYYGPPFISSGEFSRFKVITEPRAEPYDDRFHTFTNAVLDPQSGTYGLDETGDGHADYTIRNPDFTFREFRSTQLFRRENRPGSNHYQVRSQSRAGTGADGNFGFHDDFGELFHVHPYNVLAIKLSHWLSL
ncbi:MAG: carbohydrate binding family 9 domain-containing protein [Gemmatimonadetes bacterium]|nr:carbohydrate binding family 9 domain-containing protein [Gemmatimonadota bacterium]